jgi:YD repeat-containing protein
MLNSHLVEQITFKQNSTTRMTTSKQYDNLSRLTSISSVSSVSSVVSSSYQYNTANQRTAVTKADASYWLYAYDALGQVTSGKRYWSDGVPVEGQQFEYEFDDIGNRKTTKIGGDQNGQNLRTATYGPNLLNQYTNRTVPGYVEVQGSAATNATVTVNNQATYRKGEYFRKELSVFNLDNPVWQGITNIAVLQNAPNPDIVTTNQGHAFVAKTPEAFTHDADGNTLSDGRFNYTWDAENRPISAETSFAAAAAGATRQKVDWSYLPDGRWSQRIVSEWNGSAWVPQITNRFVWDGVVLLAVLDGNNQPIQAYMRGLDLSGSLTGAGGVGGLLAVSNFQSPIGTHFVANDGNGNVVALSDASNGSESARSRQRVLL